jgi:hypothetical protein
MITFTPQIISQIAESAYGQYVREAEAEIQMANWAHLDEGDRENFLARAFAWIANFRVGNRVEKIFTDREAALIYEFSEKILGRDWAWMTSQGIRLERLGDAVMTKAEAQLEAWRISDSTKGQEDGAGLQESVSAGETEVGGPTGSEQGSDSPGSVLEDRPANARANRKSTRQLESEHRRARPDRAQTSADGAGVNQPGETGSGIEPERSGQDQEDFHRERPALHQPARKRMVEAGAGGDGRNHARGVTRASR